MNKQFQIPGNSIERLDFIIDFGWEIFMKRLDSGKIIINKEASMQLHYAAILHNLGELMCINPNETFSIELEANHKVNGIKNSIDIICSIQEGEEDRLYKAAIELKCFRKGSNRAKDMDMYNVWKDISKLISYKENFQVTKFMCITDDAYYKDGKHTGHADTVRIKEGTTIVKGASIKPGWQGKWKDTNYDSEIIIDQDVVLNWNTIGSWHYLKLDV